VYCSCCCCIGGETLSQSSGSVILYAALHLGCLPPYRWSRVFFTWNFKNLQAASRVTITKLICKMCAIFLIFVFFPSSPTHLYHYLQMSISSLEILICLLNICLCSPGNFNMLIIVFVIFTFLPYNICFLHSLKATSIL
jgi:hypothetical protein